MQDILILILSSVILAAIVYKMHKTATSKEYIGECLNTREAWKQEAGGKQAKPWAESRQSHGRKAGKAMGGKA